MVEWFEPRSESSWGCGILNVLGDLRFEHEFEIEYETDFSGYRPRLKNARAEAPYYHVTYPSHHTEYPLYLKSNIKSEDFGVTGLKFENRTRTQSCTLSPI